MTNKLLKWIRKCSNLPDTQLEEYLNTIHGNSINSFLQAIDKTSTNGKRDFPAVISKMARITSGQRNTDG